MNISAEHIEIEKKFESLLVPLTDEEFRILESNILENGCIDPLLLWKQKDKDVLIDGHNRMKICQRHGIDFSVSYLKFKNNDEASGWIINNQLGRRNLTQDQVSYYRGLKYLQTKKQKGGYQNVVSKGQNDPLTSEIVAEEFKVSPSTIKRDAAYAKGIDAIGKTNLELKLQLLTGQVNFNKKDIQLFGESEIKGKVRNEADLYNKVHQIKNEALSKVEQELDDITANQEPQEVPKEDPFSSYEVRVKKIKGSIISLINQAIEKRDISAISKLKELIDRLEVLIRE